MRKSKVLQKSSNPGQSDFWLNPVDGTEYKYTHTHTHYKPEILI